MSATTDREKLMASLACISKLEALVQKLGGEEALEGRVDPFTRAVRGVIETSLAEVRALELRKCYSVAGGVLDRVLKLDPEDGEALMSVSMLAASWHDQSLELRRCYAVAADALCWAREFGPLVDGYNPPEKVEAGEAFRAVRNLVAALQASRKS